MKNTEKGASLIAICFLIVILSGAGLYVLKLQEQYNSFSDEAQTYDKERAIQDALQAFLDRNDRYPCPASLSVDYDQPGFGVEIGSDCAAAPATPGTFQAAGRAGQMVRTGAVPVRTINLPDKYIADDYNTRFIYAVTEAYAAPDAPFTGDNGAIFINDGDVAGGNSVIERDGTAIFALISPKGDDNGTYDQNGNLIAACTDVNKNRFSAENCNFDTDAIFRVTAEKSTANDNYFQQSIAYKTSGGCDNDAEVVGDVTFVIDDSGSMGSRVGSKECEEIGLRSNCTRMDVAHWAMRRALPTHMYNNHQKPGERDATRMSGFVDGMRNFRGYNTQTELEAAVQSTRANIGNSKTYTDYDQVMSSASLFEDPDKGPQSEADFDNLISDLDSRLKNICPSGGTPLGQNMMAMAMNAGDGEEDKPNKIIVLSDGYHNNGSFGTNEAADKIAKDYPNTKVDIIDMTGRNNGLASAVDKTGGSFYSISDPKALLDSLIDSMGSCVNITIEPKADPPLC